MDRGELLQWWNEACNEGVWWAPWNRILEDLSAAEAAWAPAPGRHSIWQIVEHMIFWREYFAHRVEGGAPSSEAEVEARNWQASAARTDDGWRATRDRFAASHARIGALLANPSTPPPPKPQLDLHYVLLHDCYHAGQVMYLRSLLGKPSLER